MDFIAGENREQTVLFPDTIDDFIDENNSVRVIEAYINRLNLHELGFKKPEPNTMGRPMYDPKDLIKLYVYGYMNRVRSSRRLETESKRNLEVIWLLHRLSPDHKTIANFRRENREAMKNVFRDFVQLCIRLDLYGKELIAIDGSKFKAVNATARNLNVKFLKERIKRIEEHIAEYMNELERIDTEENHVAGEKTAKEINEIVSRITRSKESYQGYVDEMERTGETQKSLTDADSRMMKVGTGKTDVCYNVQTAVDEKNKLVTEFEVINQCNDKNQISPIAESSREILEVEKLKVVTDAWYESLQDITACTKKGIEVHVAGTDFDICVPAEAGEEKEISGHYEGRCSYVPERNISLCPMGKVLYPVSYGKTNGGCGIYFNGEACKECTCKCTKTENFHFQVRMEKENFTKTYNDEGLLIKQVRIKADAELVKQRKSIVEHPFGIIKRVMDAGYCLTKGLSNVRGEFSLTFLAYNLKRVINIVGCRKLIERMT